MSGLMVARYYRRRDRHLPGCGEVLMVAVLVGIAIIVLSLTLG
jgi:hypothetical protein